MLTRVLSVGAAAGLVAGGLLADPASAQTPKRGGTLTYAIEGEVPKLDCHQEVSIYVMALARPMYSNLVRYDQNNFPNVIPDLAESWTTSPDGLAYTFKLRPGVKFHDGSTLTSADVKATFERIRNPPAGIVSQRKLDFEDLAAIETPDASTVVFRMARPSAAMLDLIASPFNCVYSARKLEENQKYPETAPMGTGPFQHVEYQRGVQNTAKRFDGYYRQGLPYLDGLRVVVMSPNAPIAAMEAGQIDALFRTLQPAQVDTLRKAMGDKITLENYTLAQGSMITINVKRKPYDDVRVRKALTMAIDRWGNLESIQKIEMMKGVGGLLRPGFDLALSPAELEKLPGWGRNGEAARAEARKLLAEAGVPNLKVSLLNRNVGTVVNIGVFALDQWRRAGIDASQEALTPQIVIERQQKGDFEVTTEGYQGSAVDDPTGFLAKFLPGNPNNLGGIDDKTLIDLFTKQKGTLDRNARRSLVNEFERHALAQAYTIPMFWSGDTPALRSYVKGWKGTSSYQAGYEMTEVWLDK